MVGHFQQTCLFSRATSAVPTSTVTETVRTVQDLVNTIVLRLKEKTKQMCQTQNVDKAETEELLNEFSLCDTLFSNLSSQRGQDKYFTEKMGLINPETVQIGVPRYEAIYSEIGNTSQKLVYDSFQYIPMLETLKDLMQDPLYQDALKADEGSTLIREFKVTSITSFTNTHHFLLRTY